MIKGQKFNRIKISNKEYELFKKAEKIEKSSKILKRIYAFKLFYKNWKYSKVANFIGVTNDTITDWIQIYEKSGIDAILTLNYKGRIPLLSEKQLIKLKQKQSSFLNAKEAKKFIKNTYGIDYKLNYVQELLKKNFNYPIKKQNLFLDE